ncbi:MAG: hypothetical protein V1851_02055 [Patescibacteria group bacterium]
MKNESNDFQKEIDYLKTIAPEKRRIAFLEYCKEKIKLEQNKTISVEGASNKICNVCSLYSDEIMPEFEEVMNIACDLELPKDFRDRSIEDWNKLVKVIENKN